MKKWVQNGTKWEKSTVTEFVHINVYISSFLHATVPPSSPTPFSRVAIGGPGLAPSRWDWVAALGGDNKKTRGHSPLLVYSAGPRKIGHLTRQGGKTPLDERSLMRERQEGFSFFFGWVEGVKKAAPLGEAFFFAAE